MIKLTDKITAVTDGVDEIHKFREQVKAVAKQAPDRPGAQEAADKLDGALSSIEGNLTRLINRTDPIMVPPKALNIRLAALTTVVQSADSRPTKQSYDEFTYLSGQENDELNQLKMVEQQQLPAFLKMVGSSPNPAQ
jgi:hypothetical protein